MYAHVSNMLKVVQSIAVGFLDPIAPRLRFRTSLICLTTHHSNLRTTELPS